MGYSNRKAFFIKESIQKFGVKINYNYWKIINIRPQMKVFDEKSRVALGEGFEKSFDYAICKLINEFALKSKER